MITIKPDPFGSLDVTCDCVCQNGIRLTPERCDDNCNLKIGYLIGQKPAHYPVPARTNLYLEIECLYSGTTFEEWEQFNAVLYYIFQ